MLVTARNVLVGVLRRIKTGLGILFLRPFLNSVKEREVGLDVISVEELQGVEVIEYARVVLEKSYSGNSRLRCTVCDKVAFRTEEEALHNRDYIHSKGGPRMRQYKGRYKRTYGQRKGTPCGWWHLSSGRR